MRRSYLLITWKVLFWTLRRWKIQSYFKPKSWCKDAIYDYWKVFFFFFYLLKMENTVIFWAKKLMKRWCLLITEKFLFWTFRRWEIRSFLYQKFVERWYSLDLVELSLILQDLRKMVLLAVYKIFFRKMLVSIS